MLPYRLLTVCIILTGHISLWCNPNDVQLVPFSKAQHESEAKRIFQENFKKSLSELLQDNIAQITVCLLNNKVIGLFVYNKDGAGSNKKGTRHIYYFAIDKPYQRKGNTDQLGYGTASMKKFEDQSYRQGITTIALDPETDDAARFFKNKFNYTPINARSSTLTKNIIATK
jgi:hypothetical protein